MYTNNSFAKNRDMRKSTKILLILYILVLIPSLILGKYLFRSIIPTENGFEFKFNIEGIISLILTTISIVLGSILFVRFIKSQPLDKALFFSSAPLVLLYGLVLFLLAELTSFENSTAKSMRLLLNISQDNLYNTILWAVLLTLVFVGILFFNYFVICKPMGRVEKIVSRLGDGKVRDDKLKIGGGKQFVSIEHGLNKINNNYKFKEKTISNWNNGTSTKMTKQFVKLLGKNEINELEIGNQVKKILTLISIKLSSNHFNEKEISMEENYNFSNSYLNIISPLIKKFNGVVDKNFNRGIIAIFLKSEDAIDCAHSISRAINIKNRQNKQNSLVIPRIVLETGEVVFSLSGNEGDSTAISYDIQKLERFDEICRNMSSRIIFPKNTLDNLPLKYKFLYRYIGKMTFDEKEIFMFEDLDNLPRDLSNLLIKSKPSFEKGVIMYDGGKYLQANEYFEKALKICPKDKCCYIYFNRSREKIQ